MTQPASGPAWKREGDTRIALSGSWNLLVDKRRRQRLLREFRRLAPPDDYCWDLQHVEALDSTGALVLWKAWDGQLPREIDCNEDQRRLFERLADTPPLTSPSGNQAPGWLSGWLDRFGSGALSVLKTGGGLLLIGQLMVDTAWCVRHPRITPWKETSANIYRIGATSMLLLGSIGLLIGAVMTIQVGLVLQMFSASQLVIGMMATAVPRELGPVVVGLIMAGRAGSAMTASIGAMHITEEYNAL
ncbi:MAG TPA: ABC transporter permease, partial [Rhodanobacteraceae bacterium]|nr:ABC transporter permease [Rhodanobacteraceae bacterium]